MNKAEVDVEAHLFLLLFRLTVVWLELLAFDGRIVLSRHQLFDCEWRRVGLVLTVFEANRGGAEWVIPCLVLLIYHKVAPNQGALQVVRMMGVEAIKVEWLRVL